MASAAKNPALLSSPVTFQDSGAHDTIFGSGINNWFVLGKYGVGEELNAAAQFQYQVDIPAMRALPRASAALPRASAGAELWKAQRTISPDWMLTPPEALMTQFYS